MILTTHAIAEYEEQVASFFRRASSKAEGEAALTEHGGQLLDVLPDLLETMKECPAYAGMAFYGRFKAVNLPLIKRLNADGIASASAIEKIRAAKALQVSASAKKGWDFLLGADLDALWSAIRLNLCRPPAVKGPKAVAANKDEHDDDGGHDSENSDSDDETHDDQEDEDDDN